MMSIPTPNLPAAEAPTAAAAGTAATAPIPGTAGGAGFMALIGALLQGTVLPTDAAPLEAGTPEIATGELCIADEAGGDAEDTDELLASMAMAQFLPLPPPAPVATGAAPAPAPTAPPPVLAGQGVVTPPVQQRLGPAGTQIRANAARVADAATLAPVQPGSEDLVQTSQTDGADFAADLLAVEESTTPTTSITTATTTTTTTTAGSSSSTAASNAGLNAWAAAANRIAGGSQETYARPVHGQSDGALREPVGAPHWKDELGTRLTLMAAQGQQGGSLRLSPEHLGPLEIQITVTDDKTNVQFGAQHAETRAALQEALPRLREMFASAGLQLGDAGVSGQAPRQRPDGATTERGFDARSDGEPTPVQGPVRSITHSGLLDTYA